MKKLLRDKSGMTLTEIVVALTILMLVIVGSTPVLLSSYDSLYTAGEYTQDTYEAKQKLYEIKDMLGGRSFAQINKSVIVNINCVKSIQAEFSGNYRIKLKSRKESLTISRKYFKEFKDHI